MQFDFFSDISQVNWPEDFLRRMQLYFGNDYIAFLNGLSQTSPVSIRMNTAKAVQLPMPTQAIPWSKDGYYLNERPSFTLDPLFHAGCYYVQEAASQFVEQLFLSALSTIKNPLVLDLCAAPGGKSTHLLSLLTGKGLLVSNEVISSRNKVLQQNIAKWGYSNSLVTQNEASDFAHAGELFDIIVVDAPCSGEGLFRRDPEAANEWSESAVANCSIRQADILEKIDQALKPGGILIYSTCTFEKSENEDQVEYLINEKKYSLVNNVKGHAGIIQSDFGYHFYPHTTKSEGFFCSMLKKDSVGQALRIKSESPKNNDKLSLAELENYMIDSSQLTSIVKDDRLYAFPKDWFSIFNYFSKKLFIRQAGIFMGTRKEKSFVPSQELALSNSIRKELPSVEVDLETALNYLRCETIVLENCPVGWTLITYRNFNLGWVKVLDRRVNNYYPKEWRIFKK